MLARLCVEPIGERQYTVETHASRAAPNHDIAMLKLMGARNGVIVGLILQQALLIGALGYGLAYWLGTFAFPKFPRLVVIETPDLLSLAAIVLGISVLSSLLGIWKAMSVEPNKVLS